MSNQDQIGVLYDRTGELLGVKYSIFEPESGGVESIDAIEFSFTEGGIATLYVESEFDTLRLELAEMVMREDCVIRDATAITPWADLMGERLAWIWLLKNQQGYEDGFRFEFSSSSKRAVTFVAIASKIDIYLSDRIDLDLPS